MAGLGARFGYKFKPFLKIGDTTFIEESVKPFLKWSKRINLIYFIFLREQEINYEVSKNLKKIFKKIKFKNIILDNPTSGPVETISKAIFLNKKKLFPSIFCDCDHSINIDKIFLDKMDLNSDICFPIWKIKKKEIKTWSVISLNKQNKIIDISEKKQPEKKGNFRGVIGCYYFKNPLQFITYSKKTFVSEIIKKNINKNKKILFYIPDKVSFFGDPDRLKNESLKRGIYIGSIFIDIDGTLILHENKPNYNKKSVVLKGSVKKINEWMKKGYYIVLCTARKSIHKNKIDVLLKKNNINYHQLITGLPSGPRILINDRKPYNILKPQSYNIDIERNEGIDNVNLSIDNISTLKQFKGGSASLTFLAEDYEKKFIRKTVSKKENISRGLLKLKNQFNYIKFLHKIDSNLTPFIYKDGEDSKNYFYDLEYLNNFYTLDNSLVKDRKLFLKILFKKLNNSIYKNKYKLNKINWLQKHLNEKILNKFEDFNDSTINKVIYDNNLLINNIKTISVNQILENKNYNQFIIKHFSPKYLSFIHGDLTYENILVSKKNMDLRIIDCDSDFEYYPLELDLGKLFQSSYLRYEKWDKNKRSLFYFNSINNVKLNFIRSEKSDCDYITLNYAKFLNLSKSKVHELGLFYMSLHLLRMIPYKIEKSLHEAQYAAFCARLILNKIINSIK